MPIIPESVTDFTVLKSYLCFLVETTENLEVKHIFSHCDEAIYSKLLQIIWRHDDEFSKVIHATYEWPPPSALLAEVNL